MKQIIGISSFDETIDAKIVIDYINSCFDFDPSKDQLFMSRVLVFNENSLGIKYSEPPFDVNNKITQKYIKELLDLSEESVQILCEEGVQQLNPKILHIFIESAHNLMSRKKGNECNPFFKVYLKTYCRDDRLIWTSKPFVSKVLKNYNKP